MSKIDQPPINDDGESKKSVKKFELPSDTEKPKVWRDENTNKKIEGFLKDPISKEKNIEEVKKEIENNYPEEQKSENTNIETKEIKPLVDKKPENKSFLKRIGNLFKGKGKNLVMGTAFLAASTIAVGQKTENKQIDNQISNTENQLKPGEKFKLIQEEKEVAGIKLEGMIVLPTIENDTTKEYVLLKFSGEGSNLLEKERLALEKLGLKPAGSDKLDKINLEAFRAAGSNVKAINSIFEKAQDLGQTKYMLVGKDLDIVVRNPIRIQSTEVDAMNKLGTTFDYATIAYRDKNNQTQEIGPDFTKRSNTIGLPGTSIADTK